MEISSFLSKSPDKKSPGSDQIQNCWLNSFPTDQRHIREKLKYPNGETTEGTDWITAGINNLLPKSADSK